MKTEKASLISQQRKSIVWNVDNSKGQVVKY